MNGKIDAFEIRLLLYGEQLTHLHGKPHIACYFELACQKGFHSIHFALLDLTTATASGDLFFSHFLQIFAHVALHERFYRAMLCGKGVSSFQTWLRTYFAEYIANNMQLLAQKGQTFPAPLPLLAHFYAGAFLSTLAWWLSHDLPYSPEQMGHYMCNLLVEGSPT